MVIFPAHLPSYLSPINKFCREETVPLRFKAAKASSEANTSLTSKSCSCTLLLSPDIARVGVGARAQEEPSLHVFFGENEPIVHGSFGGFVVVVVVASDLLSQAKDAQK